MAVLKYVVLKGKRGDRMKKIKLIAMLLGVAFVFGNSLGVFSKEENTKKYVSGQFDCFFNDKTMNRKYYGKLQNEAKEKDANELATYKNKTNVNHMVA